MFYNIFIGILWLNYLRASDFFGKKHFFLPKLLFEGPAFQCQGNGIIDDVYGADFANGDGDPFDDQMHGTHCAGTIAGGRWI